MSASQRQTGCARCSSIQGGISMPLTRGKSTAAVSHNVKQLIKDGYSQAQAVAIAMRKAGKSKPKIK